jgi:hypothetical protein
MRRPGNPLTDTIRRRGSARGATFVLSLSLVALFDIPFKPVAMTGAPAAAETTAVPSQQQQAALVSDIDTCDNAERRKKLVRTCIEQGGKGVNGAVSPSVPRREAWS